MNILRRAVAYAPTIVLARRNLSRATARSTLAVLAVVIGVVAIGGIGTGGEAFKQDQLEAYEGFGGTATVTPVVQSDDPGTDEETFSKKELTRMQQATDSGTVVPVKVSFRSLIQTASGDTIPTAQVKSVGSPEEFYTVSSGEVPNNWDQTAVVGARVANDHDISVGDRITVAVEGDFDRTFQVSAVLEPQGFADPLTADQSVFLPLSQFEDEAYDQALVSVDPQTGSIDEAASHIESEFNVRERTVFVEPVQEQRERFVDSFATINQFLVGVGAISLLVAAVTIANTMLMSAIEREAEIGVLRAVGYPRGAVVRILVAEAVILGLIGGLVGAPIALGIGLLSNTIFVGDPLAFTAAGFRYVGVGVGFGVLTALVAGVYPAWKAANKRPVEALD